MKTYLELLRDPRWQRKRLEVLDAARFSCEDCGATDKTLHVHHRYYRKGWMPWSYQGYQLASLCEDCHAAAHQRKCELEELMSMLNPQQIESIIDHARAILRANRAAATSKG